MYELVVWGNGIMVIVIMHIYYCDRDDEVGRSQKVQSSPKINLVYFY